MGATANENIGMVAGVAGNQVFIGRTLFLQLMGKEKRTQFFRDVFLVDALHANVLIFGQGGVDLGGINANGLMVGCETAY